MLPTFTLSLVYLAHYSRLARSSMLDVLGSDFIRTARAKGLSDRVVLYKHALRNALLPVVTVLGLQFGNVLAGASWSRRSSTGRAWAGWRSSRCCGATTRPFWACCCFLPWWWW